MKTSLNLKKELEVALQKTENRHRVPALLQVVLAHNVNTHDARLEYQDGRVEQLETSHSRIESIKPTIEGLQQSFAKIQRDAQDARLQADAAHQYHKEQNLELQASLRALSGKIDIFTEKHGTLTTAFQGFQDKMQAMDDKLERFFARNLESESLRAFEGKAGTILALLDAYQKQRRPANNPSSVVGLEISRRLAEGVVVEDGLMEACDIGLSNEHISHLRKASGAARPFAFVYFLISTYYEGLPRPKNETAVISLFLNMLNKHASCVVQRKLLQFRPDLVKLIENHGQKRSAIFISFDKLGWRHVKSAVHRLSHQEVQRAVDMRLTGPQGPQPAAIQASAHKNPNVLERVRLGSREDLLRRRRSEDAISTSAGDSQHSPHVVEGNRKATLRRHKNVNYKV